MSRLLAGLGVLAAAAVVVVLLLALGWWQSEGRLATPSTPLLSTASLSVRSLAFGDPVTARLDLLVNPSAIDAASIRVTPRFSPYRIVGTSRRTRTAGAVLVSYRYALECLTPECVPPKPQVERQFLPAFVSYRTSSGASARQVVDWPSYQISSRVSDADRAAPTERLRTDAALPAPSYRIDPSTLRALLTALSVALALGAAALAALALRRKPHPAAAAGPPLSPLDQALQRVRASTANGRPDERRRALGRLARELLAVNRDALAHDATRLAWSENSPSPESTGAFAAHVEASCGEER
jgi:hypothetical protein